MDSILQFVLQHGYFILFAAIFAHQIGVPLPGPLFLIAGGALAAAGNLNLSVSIGLAVTACVLADWVWYEAGRRGGDRILYFIHSLTRNPEVHNRRAKAVFTRYGLPIFLIAKFVPGLDALSPPLAGIARTRRLHFLACDAAGAAIYSCAYTGLGYIFSHDLNRAAAYAGRAGKVLIVLLLVGLLIYAGSRLVLRNRSARGSEVARIPAEPNVYRAPSVDDQCGSKNKSKPIIDGNLTAADDATIAIAQEPGDENFLFGHG